MVGVSKVAARAAPIVLAGVLLTGCVTIQAIEPVMEPPAAYQVDALAPVEFLHPTAVGFRCAERGAKLFGLPGINAMACADRTLITMPDPCVTLTAGAYAAALCAGAERLRADDGQNDDPASPRLIQASLRAPGAAPALPLAIEFVAPDSVAYRCAERGAKMLPSDDENGQACFDDVLLTVSNPCTLTDGGWYARLLCHELAHANGWPHNHATGTLIATAPVLPLRMNPLQKAFAERGIPPAAFTLAAAVADTSFAPPSAPNPSPNDEGAVANVETPALLQRLVEENSAAPAQAVRDATETASLEAIVVAALEPLSGLVPLAPAHLAELAPAGTVSPVQPEPPTALAHFAALEPLSGLVPLAPAHLAELASAGAVSPVQSEPPTAPAHFAALDPIPGGHSTSPEGAPVNDHPSATFGPHPGAFAP